MRGVDMFDCVLPTRSGRNGQGLTWNGPVNMRSAKRAEDSDPTHERFVCPVCKTYSRTYLRHLINSAAMLDSMLLTLLNLSFNQALMAGMRDAIREARLRRLSGYSSSGCRSR